MKANDVKNLITLGGIAATAVLAAYTYLKKQKIKADAEVEKLKVEASYPPEYWVAKQVEARTKADVKKAEIEANKNLTIDYRDREDAMKKAKMEFEKDAPQEYWNHKEVVEKERSRRHQMDIDRDLAKERDRIDRDIARRNAQAIENGARSLERAVSTFGNR